MAEGLFGDRPIPGRPDGIWTRGTCDVKRLDDGSRSGSDRSGVPVDNEEVLQASACDERVAAEEAEALEEREPLALPIDDGHRDAAGGP
jgi:hypothetical protein